jgi:hypothetical protein
MDDVLPGLDNECFFIAPIGEENSEVRKRSDGVLDFIVARAADELGLTAVRADRLAEPGQINFQVIEHVLGAKAAVVDLTGLNPNVFYELAIRHTMRKPVALIADKGCALPFDIAQMRTIFFDHQDLASADGCRREIVKHLREALDGGAVDSPIATAVDLGTLQTGSPVDRTLVELLTRLDDIGNVQRSLAEGMMALGELLPRTRRPRQDEMLLREYEHAVAAVKSMAQETQNPALAEAAEIFDVLGDAMWKDPSERRRQAANPSAKPSLPIPPPSLRGFRDQDFHDMRTHGFSSLEEATRSDIPQAEEPFRRPPEEGYGGNPR